MSIFSAKQRFFPLFLLPEAKSSVSWTDNFKIPLTSLTLLPVWTAPMVFIHFCCFGALTYISQTVPVLFKKIMTLTRKLTGRKPSWRRCWSREKVVLRQSMPPSNTTQAGTPTTISWHRPLLLQTSDIPAYTAQKHAQSDTPVNESHGHPQHRLPRLPVLASHKKANQNKDLDSASSTCILCSE